MDRLQNHSRKLSDFVFLIRGFSLLVLISSLTFVLYNSLLFIGITDKYLSIQTSSVCAFGFFVWLGRYYNNLKFDSSIGYIKGIICFWAILVALNAIGYLSIFTFKPIPTETGLFVIYLTSWIATPIVFHFQKNRVLKNQKTSQKEVLHEQESGLNLGISTGYLQSLAHGSGMNPEQAIILNTKDAAQNILVLGGIGSGKTTCIIHPLLLQVLKKGYGGLIFDIKGDFIDATIKLAKEANREEIWIFGPGHEPMNLLFGLSPEIAASFLKSAFLLGGGSRPDSFWIDTATELCRNALGVLSFLPKYYNLEGLRSYIFEEDRRDELDAEVRAILPELDERQTRLLRSYLNYHESIFSRFDEKVVSGVEATVSQVLSPFDHPDLVDAFCTTPSTDDEYGPFQLEHILLPFVVVIDLPLARWGLAAKVVYTLIKLRFFNLMQTRHSNTEYDYDDPVFFMCDEYQEILSANKDGLSDLNFWDKSRSSKTIGIISTQSVSSIYASINNRDLANAILQNFRQKICFRTEDQNTINLFQRLLGRVEVEKIGSSFGESNSNTGLSLSSYSKQWTENVTTIEKNVLDPQLVRNLQQGQALALLSINGISQDDVVNTTPKYV